MGWLFEQRCWHALFLIAVAAGVIVGAESNSLGFLIAAIAAFAVWDFIFCATAEALDDRSDLEVLEAINDAKTVMSTFVLLYGGLLAYAVASDKAAEFLKLCTASNVPHWLPMVPLIIAAFAAMFVPVRRSVRTIPPQAPNDPNVKLADATWKLAYESNKPSEALRSMLMLVIFLQKCALVILAYCIMAVGFDLQHQLPVQQSAKGPTAASSTTTTANAANRQGSITMRATTESSASGAASAASEVIVNAPTRSEPMSPPTRGVTVRRRFGIR